MDYQVNLVDSEPVFDGERQQAAALAVTLAKAEGAFKDATDDNRIGAYKRFYDNQLGDLDAAIQILNSPACPVEFKIQYRNQPGGYKAFAALLARFTDWQEKQILMARAVKLAPESHIAVKGDKGRVFHGNYKKAKEALSVAAESLTGDEKLTAQNILELV